ncbi:uncharacterized protein PAC_08884 [Phialocephala subalpina]|uniref:Uncharacterized protein n=1 Tax=Phialocephala subalpina TaxID=576137 RepID=A0A1L7X1V8_9HELO|nr:uncharacterized protein PAC_08884 [Phialocephala subalpina]
MAGCLYQAVRISDGTLFDIRVYSFDGEDTIERRHIKRNCREWKERRRFLVSCKVNGLVFLVLRKSQVEIERSTVEAGKVKDASTAVLADISDANPHFSQEKALKQKEKARKYQQIKRRKKRADRCTTVPIKDLEAQRGNTKTHLRWQAWLKKNDRPPKEDTRSAADGWYWAPGGGWRRQLVYLDDGSSHIGIVWSTLGGYMHVSGKLPISPNFLGVDSGEQEVGHHSSDLHYHATPHKSRQQLDDHSEIKTEKDREAVPGFLIAPKNSEANEVRDPQRPGAQSSTTKERISECNKTDRVKIYYWLHRKHMNFGGFVRLSFVASSAISFASTQSTLFGLGAYRRISSSLSNSRNLRTNAMPSGVKRVGGNGYFLKKTAMNP